MSKFKGFFKKNWRIIIVGLLLIFNALLQVPTIKSYVRGIMPFNWVNLGLILVYLIIETIERVFSNVDIMDIKVGVDETKETTKEIKEVVKVIEKEVIKYKPVKNKKYEKTKLLANLINENVISIKTIEKNIADKNFISVLCYQKGFTANKPKNMQMRRKYPSIFKNLGFIQLAGVWGYFIIPEENIFPKKLRNLNNLAIYVLHKAKMCLISEWREIMRWAKKGSLRFYRNRTGKANPLNFNMLIMRFNRRNMIHMFLKSNDFNIAFNNELVSLTKLNEVKIRQNDKIKIKNFVLQSSLNILVLGVPNEDKNKLLALEKTFVKPVRNKGLGIKNFYDYHNQNEVDILKIISTKFSPTKAKEYTDLIFKRSKKYQEALTKLGIKIE